MTNRDLKTEIDVADGHVSNFSLEMGGAAPGKSIWFSGFRQVLFGLLAAATTFGIGKLIGVSVGDNSP